MWRRMRESSVFSTPCGRLSSSGRQSWTRNPHVVKEWVGVCVCCILTVMCKGFGPQAWFNPVSVGFRTRFGRAGEADLHRSLERAFRLMQSQGLFRMHM